MKKMPVYNELMNPLITALRDLGGSGSNDEIYSKVLQNLKIPEDVSSVLHASEGSNVTEIQYRLAWARTYLKKYGVVTNSNRGVWALTKTEQAAIDPKEVVKFVKDRVQKQKQQEAGLKAAQAFEEETPEESPEEVQSWRTTLYRILTTSIDPSSFERLIQRLLRESGFVQVEVTGRTGDGGIDGKGIARIHGFMSFHVVFQCKRYQGVVSPSHIRDSAEPWLAALTKAYSSRQARSPATPSRKRRAMAHLQSISWTVSNSRRNSRNSVLAFKPK